jgi:hypothetical protein
MDDTRVKVMEATLRQCLGAALKAHNQALSSLRTSPTSFPPPSVCIAAADIHKATMEVHKTGFDSFLASLSKLAGPLAKEALEENIEG